MASNPHVLRCYICQKDYAVDKQLWPLDPCQHFMMASLDAEMMLNHQRNRILNKE